VPAAARLIIEGTALTLVAGRAVQCQRPSPAGAFQEVPGPGVKPPASRARRYSRDLLLAGRLVGPLRPAAPGGSLPL